VAQADRDRAREEREDLLAARGGDIAERVEVASNPWSRFWGLMGRRGLDPGHGLLIKPCSSIHMFFMRFPIDVVFLDRDNVVVKVVHGIKPWRMAMGEFGPGLRSDREGIDWIRGWHNEKSDEVLALLAAAALVHDG